MNTGLVTGLDLVSMFSPIYIVYARNIEMTSKPVTTRHGLDVKR